ncbi:atp-dependent rna helicase dbp10 [Zalerion maritima]|uniref:RNA helicase n=1 Tax=Zalerion maritima TaxID=339359 RepID=A0AAD5WT61_9PEZI|nr:atp-dependent rna helicase dbp10 [Zalerion maritima]
MRHHAASPTPSENDVDILGELVDSDLDSVGVRVEHDEKKANGLAFDADHLLSIGSEDGKTGEEEDEAFIALQQAASFRKNTNIKGKSVKKGGGFQAMGLSSSVLRAITRKGFLVPTPIQRKTIPLILDKRDVVGMARTGSGKTAAFVVPMIERLRTHSARVGARALVMSPSRELALQTLKVVKEFSRGTDLKCVLLVGGDSLEEQFSMMATNPDIVIATPGRFLHLKVEMSLDLSSIQYIVFDEADRLFEMGFAAQLTEILHSLPMSRQTLLFSATLPKSLVEFARAGLQEPSLVRLDAETKISPDLQSAFFGVKSAEKDGALLHILHDIIKVPTGLPPGVEPERGDERPSKKRKRGAADGAGRPTEHSTIVFTATKHHVEYLNTLLRESDFAVSYVYGSLDQVARKNQVESFRKGRSNILVVTDVAARGIDIPVLANVINYDFPPQPKIFVHRVGRTARAGQRGWSYSLVQSSDVPYLLDLQLFLGRKLIVGQDQREMATFADDVVVGALRRDQLEHHVEAAQHMLKSDDDIEALRTIVGKAEKLYKRTRNSASAESAKRARELVASKPWMQLHLMFGKDAGDMEQARVDMLSRLSGYRPQETIFEVGTKGRSGVSEAADVMRNIREKIKPRRAVEKTSATAAANDGGDDDEGNIPADEANWDTEGDDEEDKVVDDGEAGDPELGHESDSEFEVTISNSTSKKPSSFQDSEVFMSYTPRSLSAAEEKGYGVHSGGNFVETARDVAMDLTNDEAKSFGLPTRSKMRWDQKGRKYVSRVNDEDGSRGAKMIKGESGVKIAASFKSGRFEKWKHAHRLGKMPRVGEQEKGTVARLAADDNNVAPSGYKFKHKQEKAPKQADKYRDDYHVRKKRVAEAKEKRIGQFKDGAGSKHEIKNQEDIRKARVIKERKREKNARPTKKARRR